MNLSAFLVELKVKMQLYYLPVVTGKQSPRKAVGLVKPGSQIRRYTPVYQCLNDGLHGEGDSGGYRRPFC